MPTLASLNAKTFLQEISPFFTKVLKGSWLQQYLLHVVDFRHFSFPDIKSKSPFGGDYGFFLLFGRETLTYNNYESSSVTSALGALFVNPLRLVFKYHFLSKRCLSF